MERFEELNKEQLAIKLRELTEENTALFNQLHVVQENLERYHNILQEYAQKKEPGILEKFQANERMVQTLAEAKRLQVFAEQQKLVSEVEKHNSLACRLGNTLINAKASAWLPTLWGMWRSLAQTTPPACLGGADFSQVIIAYDTDGENAVESLLNRANLSHVMRANAYTALARHLSEKKSDQYLRFARLAWESDPQPFRLKWWATRVYEAGDVPTAAALLDLLPEDISLNEAEQRQIVRIRQEAERKVQQEVRNEIDILEEQQDYAQRMQQLEEKFKNEKKRADSCIKKEQEQDEKIKKMQKDLNMVKKKYEEQVKMSEELVDKNKKLNALIEKNKEKSISMKKSDATNDVSLHKVILKALMDKLTYVQRENESYRSELVKMQIMNDVMQKLTKDEELKLLPDAQTKMLSTVFEYNDILFKDN